MRNTPSMGKMLSLSVFTISSGRGAASATIRSKSQRCVFTKNMQSQWPSTQPSMIWFRMSVTPAVGALALMRSSMAVIHQEYAPPPLRPVTPKRALSTSGRVSR